MFSHIKLNLSFVYFLSLFMTTAFVPLSAFLRFICLSPFSAFSASHFAGGKFFFRFGEVYFCE